MLSCKEQMKITKIYQIEYIMHKKEFKYKFLNVQSDIWEYTKILLIYKACTKYNETANCPMSTKSKR